MTEPCQPHAAPILELSAGRGRVTIRLVAVPLGPDLAVSIGGGEAHVGAVAVAQPRPSHAPGGAPSATCSVIALPGHREDELAREAASRLAARLGGVVTVACGIHLDRISPAEIATVRELVSALVDDLATRLTPPAR